VLKRIYNKGLNILDLTIGKVHLFLEQKKLIKEMEYSVYSKKDNEELVSHNYPANYVTEDKALFAHYTNYKTFAEIIYKFDKINIAERGIVFSRLNNTMLSLPHPVFRAEFGWLYILNNYFFRKRTVLPADEIYILLYDFWSSANYYHWLVDSMPRILSVKHLLKEKEFVLLLPEKCPSYILRALSYFEINEIKFLKKSEYFFAEQLVLPYYLAGSGHIHPTKVFEVKHFYLSALAPQKGNDRIYVSRSRQKARQVINEEEVISLVKAYGFRIVYFEDHTFEEQVKLANGASIMVSSHGANMTNLMFMAENTRVLELIRSNHPNFCYWALATVSKVNYYYQLCQVKGNDHLLVDVNVFRSNLEKLLND